jgi:hypothetical protein
MIEEFLEPQAFPYSRYNLAAIAAATIFILLMWVVTI